MAHIEAQVAQAATGLAALAEATALGDRSGHSCAVDKKEKRRTMGGGKAGTGSK